ncbi:MULTISPECIES: DUF420 domain-containing protein [unclassified Nitrospina]|uniref:DUF420 domain-containing protein n=1 Tax=unclassified Nitrospina TaxID=2638683 RepID=UPI003F9DBBFC
MKETLAKPGFLIATSTLGADLSYLLAVIFTVMFLFAWWQAKKGDGTRHHKLILVSMVSMVVYFIGYYYTRSLGVLSLEGKEGFGGPESIYNNVFIPILTTHLVLVTLGLILTPYMIIEGFRASKKVDGKWTLQTGVLKANPARFKRIYIWLLTIWAGLQVVLMAAGKSIGSMIAYFLIFLTIALVISVEKLIEKLLPEGDRRHRILGRGTMVLFALILVTSTATYLLLYVFYPVRAA